MLYYFGMDETLLLKITNCTSDFIQDMYDVQMRGTKEKKAFCSTKSDSFNQLKFPHAE